MAAIDEAKHILTQFFVELSDDLEESLNRALRDGGRGNPQKAALSFKHDIYDDGPGVSATITASGDYWKYIESGRKKGAKRIPADVVGKVWQNTNNIDPRQVLMQLRLKKVRKLKTAKNKLNYDKAAKSLSFVIQNSIFKKGIKPKPFVDRVIEDGRIEVLSSTLRQVLGKEYKLEIIADFT